MDSAELIELFYNRTYEKFVNKQILDDKNYIVPRQQLINYVHELIDIPYIEFIEYLKNRSEIIIVNSTYVTHFSTFSACEIDMCNALIWANNPGCTFVEIGRLFPESVSSRNDIAYRLFGEKHIKAATQLGLTFEYYDYWYLNCIGYIYPDLDQDDRMQLLARTITRNDLYRKMLVDIMDHDVYPELYLTMFSGSSLKSRIKNVVTFFDICIEECKINNISTHRLYRRNANIDSSGSLDVLTSGKKRSIYSLYRSYEILSIDEMITLFMDYKYRGDLNAFDLLVKSYLRLVLSTAKLFEGKGLEYDDLVQEGTLGLIKAIEKYDFIQGVSFGFYAKTWIKQSIIQAINTQSLTVKIPQNQLILYNRVRKEVEKYEQKNEFNPSITEIEIGEDIELDNLSYLGGLPDDLHELVSRKENLDDYPSVDFSADDIVMKESKIHFANSLLRKLKHRESDILRSVFGIGVKEETLEEIGDRLCLTRERVRQIKEKAIRKLRGIIQLSNDKEQDDHDDEEPKEKELTLEETERRKRLHKILNRSGRNKKESSDNRQRQLYRIVNKDETFEIRGVNNTLLFNTKGYVKSINDNLYCLRFHYSYLSIYLIKVSGYEFKIGELIIHASKSSHLYQLLIGNKYDKINDIKQDYSNKEYKVHADDNWYDNSGLLIIEGAKKAHEENVSNLYSDKEVSVGDRILYNSKPCIVLEIIIKYSITRLKIKYDDGRIDNVLGDLKRVEFLKHQDSNCSQELSTPSLQKEIIEQEDIPNNKKEILSKMKSRDELRIYYKQLIMKLKQAIVHGKTILAKPALLVAVIDSIDSKEIRQNAIIITTSLEKKYNTILAKYTGETQFDRLTSIAMPFWHLQSDKLWFLEPQYPRKKDFSPSKKWLLDNVKYARLDDDLWYLLQDDSWRNELRNYIIYNKLICKSTSPNKNDQIEYKEIYSRDEKKDAPQFLMSTSLSDLVGLGIITETQLKHCNKRGLRTIGDVKKNIEYYHLTPNSTRFTKYTLNMWFGIIGLLNNNE